MYCRKCGAKIPADAMSCKRCGYKLRESDFIDDDNYEYESQTYKKRSSKTGLTIIALLLLAACSLLGVMYFTRDARTAADGEDAVEYVASLLDALQDKDAKTIVDAMPSEYIPIALNMFGYESRTQLEEYVREKSERYCDLFFSKDNKNYADDIGSMKITGYSVYDDARRDAEIARVEAVLGDELSEQVSRIICVETLRTFDATQAVDDVGESEYEESSFSIILGKTRDGFKVLDVLRNKRDQWESYSLFHRMGN